VGSPLLSGNNEGKAIVARNGVLYSFNGSSPNDGQFITEVSKVFLITSFSSWPLILTGKKLCALFAVYHYLY
jgi:hypothetical protein